MTKREAIAEFSREWSYFHYSRLHPIDRAALREAWNNYTDGLCKSGRITMKQYETWVGPYK